MDAMILGFYLGLFVFAINGLQLVALRQERKLARARDERLFRVLMAKRGTRV